MFFYLSWRARFDEKNFCPLGWSKSESMIQVHPDYGASKETRNPFWERISRFLWSALMHHDPSDRSGSYPFSRHRASRPHLNWSAASHTNNEQNGGVHILAILERTVMIFRTICLSFLCNIRSRKVFGVLTIELITHVVENALNDVKMSLSRLVTVPYRSFEMIDINFLVFQNS